MTQDMNKCLFGEWLPKQFYLTVWVEHDDAVVAGENAEAETDFVITAPWWCLYWRCKRNLMWTRFVPHTIFVTFFIMCSCCGDRD